MIDLKITIIQADLVWEDISSNLAAFSDKIDSIQDDTHLIVLPEMFTTGFSLDVEKNAQEMDGESVEWLMKKSREKGADITGSIIIREGGNYYNRMLWAKPDGTLLKYDKRHLFKMVGEDKIYSPGKKNITVDLHGWKIRPFVCYDLRFPAWIRNTGDLYDAALFIANWPVMRSAHWKLLLQARAVENQCYVAGVNRVGEDDNKVPHSGDSSIISPYGEIKFQKSDAECIHTEELSYAILQKIRKAFPFLGDADDFMIDVGS